jgi:predicted transcriptional regulator of viral defense system
MAAYITDTVKDTIKKIACGYVFTAKDFPLPVEKQKTVNKLLDNMVAAGQIRRLSKGRFYKPQMSNFGELPPDTFQTVKDLIEKNGKPIGYLTGYSLFNKFGLTTQVPVTLQIAMQKVKKAITRGNYRIGFLIQPNTITKENIPILQLLDCLRYFKDIPDTMPDEACRRLLFLFKQLTDKQIIQLKRFVLQYNPATIALLGALLETINEKEDTSLLFNALNHQTSYQFGISQDILSNQKKWNIR